MEIITETQLKELNERTNDTKFSVAKIYAWGKNKLQYRYTAVDSKSSVIVQRRNLGIIVDFSLRISPFLSAKIEFEALFAKEMRAKVRTWLSHHIFPVCPCVECAVLVLLSQWGNTQHWKCVEKGDMGGQRWSKALRGFWEEVPNGLGFFCLERENMMGIYKITNKVTMAGR